MWPFIPTEQPSNADISRKEEVIKHIEDLLPADSEPIAGKITKEEEKNWADLGRALADYARLLRDADRLDEAEEASSRVKEIWQKLDRPKAVLVNDMLHATILAKKDDKARAMRLLEMGLQKASNEDEFKPYLDSLLIHRAGLFYLYGTIGLATKDLDHALMLRNERQGKIDETILEYRKRILMMEEEASKEAAQS